MEGRREIVLYFAAKYGLAHITVVLLFVGIPSDTVTSRTGLKLLQVATVPLLVPLAVSRQASAACVALASAQCAVQVQGSCADGRAGLAATDLAAHQSCVRLRHVDSYILPSTATGCSAWSQSCWWLSMRSPCKNFRRCWVYARKHLATQNIVLRHQWMKSGMRRGNIVFCCAVSRTVQLSVDNYKE